jgi:ActR/RegA family two-component response regulator
MPQLLLIVEPDKKTADLLAEAAAPFARVQTAHDFASARILLAEGSYDWLITNMRLGEYNGLHLIYLVTSTRAARHTLVYDGHGDPWLAREAQQIGACYERGDRVARAIPGYLLDALPARDRREPCAAAALVHPAIVVTYRVEREPSADVLES